MSEMADMRPTSGNVTELSFEPKVYVQASLTRDKRVFKRFRLV
jgi:hypothetical protein